MKIVFSCDHAWYAWRDEIVSFLISLWHEVIDVWPQTLEPLDDFPDYAKLVCENIIEWNSDRGVLVCGTGIGMSIAANRYSWIRAVIAWDTEMTKISRSHNDTNVICFWARTMKIEDVLNSLEVFLNTDFIGGKYQRRNEKMEKY